MDFRQQKRTAQKTPSETKRSKKTLGIYKRNKTQNLADERRIMGRFAKRVSGERPISLGLQSWPFYPSFSKLFGGCLSTAKRCACISQAPAKELFIFSIAVGKFLTATNRKFFSKILQMIVKQKFWQTHIKRKSDITQTSFYFFVILSNHFWYIGLTFNT